MQGQASYLAYMDAFWVLMLISLSAVPLALMLRTIKLGGPACMAQHEAKCDAYRRIEHGGSRNRQGVMKSGSIGAASGVPLPMGEVDLRKQIG